MTSQSHLRFRPRSTEWGAGFPGLGLASSCHCKAPAYITWKIKCKENNSNIFIYVTTRAAGRRQGQTDRMDTVSWTPFHGRELS